MSASKIDPVASAVVDTMVRAFRKQRKAANDRQYRQDLKRSGHSLVYARITGEADGDYFLRDTDRIVVSKPAKGRAS